MRPTKTSWGHVAAWYDALLSKEGTYQKEVILPNLLRLADIFHGEHILDLACGQGFFSFAFADAGAAVLGVDIAEPMIGMAMRLAREHPQGRGSVAFAVSSAEQLPMVSDRSMDMAALILAIQNIENMQGVFQEVSRVLKPGGRLLLVMNHPAFRVPRQSSWGTDTATGGEYRRIDAYMSDDRAAISMHPGEAPGVSTVTFHRPLQSYAKALAKAGLCVTRLEEWISNRKPPRGKTFTARDRARKEIPLFLFLEARHAPS